MGRNASALKFSVSLVVVCEVERGDEAGASGWSERESHRWNKDETRIEANVILDSWEMGSNWFVEFAARSSPCHQQLNPRIDS